MIENETSLGRIDSDTDDMLESYVFDQSEPIERRVLGDTVCLTGKFRGDHVPSLDAYVPRHKIGTESSKRKQIQSLFDIIGKLKHIQSPQVVPGVPAAIARKSSQPILTVADCRHRYFETTYPISARSSG